MSSLFVIAGFLGLLAFGIAQWGRVVKVRREHDETADEQPPRAAPVDARADAPRAFGARMAWFAVQAASIDEVLACLPVRTLRPANWASGLAAARSEGVFVTPPARGVVFVAGRDAFPRLRSDVEPVLASLRALGRRFGTAWWFATHDVADFHGWAIAKGDLVLRAFAYDGDGPAIVLDEGAVTESERGLGFFVDDPRDTSDDPLKWWPTTGDVLALARAEGVDPTALDRGGAPGTGRLGRL